MKPLYDLHSLKAEEAGILDKKIDVFNAQQLAFTGKVEEFKNYVIKEQGQVIAGIKTCLYFEECMFVTILFVDEPYRKKGLGSLLLRHAEHQAKSVGIKLSHLDTFDFQAKDFYLKQGYEIFGVLNDCPKGHNRYYLKKFLI